MAPETTRKNDRKTVSCPVETAIATIGGRWKVLVNRPLIEGSKRFGELSRLPEGISPRTLTRQLRELEDGGVIKRKEFQEMPPRVEHSLTVLGCELQPVLQSMHVWGDKVERSQSVSGGKRRGQENP